MRAEVCNFRFISTLITLKGAFSNFPRMEIFIQMTHHHPRKRGAKFQLNRSNRLNTSRDCVLQLPMPYCASFIMATIAMTTSHIFIDIFHLHFSAVKFTRGNDINIVFLLIPNSQKVWHNLKQSDWTPLISLQKYSHTAKVNDANIF